VAFLLTMSAAFAVVPACHRSRLPPRADGAAVVLVAPDAGSEPGVTIVTEVEPNGAITTAQKLDLIDGAALAVSGAVAAADGKAKDVDVYRLVVPPPLLTPAAAPAAAHAATDGAAAAAGLPPPTRRRLAALVRPDAALAVSVDLLDDAGQILLSSPGGAAGEVEGFPAVAVSPGVYFLRVRGASSSSTAAAAAAGEGSYRATLRLTPLEAGEELEPNGKSALAADLPTPGEAIGYLGWRKDQDWYRVPLDGLADGSVLSADLEAVPGVTASLLVFDSVERKLTEAHGRKEERVVVRNIRLPAGEPHLFLQVRADAGRNVDLRYNLRVRTDLPKAGAAGGELEPNDDAQHANPLGDGTVLGYFGRGDVDVYRYTAAEPLELDIEVAPPERVDLKLEVIREPDGLLLVRSDVGKRHEPERVPNLFAPAGSLLIRLVGGKADGNPDEPYRLTVASHRPEAGAEREPNGTAASATPLPAGATGTGLLFPRGDVDYWQAPATPDAEGNVAVTVTGIAGTALELRVLSQSEKELARFKVTGEAPVTNRLVTGGDGCCLLHVREASGKAGNFRDRYTVTVGR
jgi:hypothetical protein